LSMYSTQTLRQVNYGAFLSPDLPVAFYSYEQRRSQASGLTCVWLLYYTEYSDEYGSSINNDSLTLYPRITGSLTNHDSGILTLPQYNYGNLTTAYGETSASRSIPISPITMVTSCFFTVRNPVTLSVAVTA